MVSSHRLENVCHHHLRHFNHTSMFGSQLLLLLFLFLFLFLVLFLFLFLVLVLVLVLFFFFFFYYHFANLAPCLMDAPLVCPWVGGALQQNTATGDVFCPLLIEIGDFYVFLLFTVFSSYSLTWVGGALWQTLLYAMLLPAAAPSNPIAAMLI